MGMLVACDSEQAQQLGNRDQPTADWVLTGGKIFTVDDDRPWAEAIAIKDGTFLYVGDDAGITSFVTDDTRKSDLGGRLVIPGLVDSHAHPGLLDVKPYAAPLPETSKADILKAVQEYADSNPQLEWIRMCCWQSGGKSLSRRLQG
jgi:predicted amidohydrolase YtcJ